MGKYTAKKQGTSHYPERLAARGLSPVQVRMPFFDNQGRKHSTMAGATEANRKKSGNYKGDVGA